MEVINMQQDERKAESVSNHDLFDIIYDWWLKTSKSSGDRANLRRARTPDMVAIQSSYLGLYREIVSCGISDKFKWRLNQRLPLIAGVLSHVKENRNESVAFVMGSSTKSGSENPVVSDLRFRRLMKTDDDSLYIMIIRMIRMMDGKVNVKNLSESLFFWDDMTRKKWASQYYLHKDIYLKEISN